MRIHTALCAFLLLPVLLTSQNRYDIVISEIMADPTPSAGLPGYEWIELTNASNSSVNIAGWRIADASGQSGPFPTLLLQPDSSVIICSSTAAPALTSYGKTLAVTSFPSVDNEGDLLYLKAANGKTIHAVRFNANWYGNALKKEGGWSLEMTDIHNPCAGRNNWIASTAPNGGTPGKSNAVRATLPDTEAPHLLRSYTTGPATIVLVFDEPVDSSAASISSSYAVSGGIVIQKANAIPPLFNEVILQTTTPLATGTVYTVKAGSLPDCAGNSSTPGSEARTGIAGDAQTGDWVINEVLFNPRTNGDDYAEFFASGKKILDASRLFIAGRGSNGAVSNSRQLSETPVLIFPGDYLAVTVNTTSLAREYHVAQPSRVLELASLPSFPDEDGTVVALNFQGEVVDELHYSDAWHFKLLNNTEGVSLERIDPHTATQDAQNWHSASSTSGYGTPGYINSQHRIQNTGNATVEISPKLFSPDNDGRDDFTRIQYSLSEQGYVANIVIYNANGRAVRNLVHNGLLSATGYWNWDGLDDTGKKLPSGTYIVFTEVFNLQGKKQHFKQAVVLAGYL